jgi:predicted transglutaminase-like cysteine proteinase
MTGANIRRFVARAAFLAGICVVSAIGHRAHASDLDPPAFSAVSHLPGCDGAEGTITFASAHPLGPNAPAEKARAILGGQPSALELVRMAQESGGPANDNVIDLAATVGVQLASLEPAASGVRLQPASCVQGLAPNHISPRDRGYTSEDFLASKRLAIGRTTFDGDWQRVRADDISPRRLRSLVGSLSEERLETLRTVNAWVNRTIEFTDDSDLFGRADYWAGARKTLKLGRGDCEDIALTKMQLLAAAGISRADMILTIARDLVRNSDHAVLIVRHGDGYVMLDNSTDEILDASWSHDYRPVLSFGKSQTWLHGY